MSIEEESCDTNPDELIELRKKITGVERRFNQTRELLYYKVRTYFNQSIASVYVNENDIQELLDELVAIKSEYFEIQKEILEKRPELKIYPFHILHF